MTRSLPVALALILALAACGPWGEPGPRSFATSVSAAPASPEAASGLDMQPLDEGTPVSRSEPGVAAAFDAAAAADLLDNPPTLEPSRALICVFLGERIGRWTFDLQSMQLTGSMLEIDARERPPRTPSNDKTTPAACATVRRDALPVGELKVTAHDTVSDEFITDGTIDVPSAASGS